MLPCPRRAEAPYNITPPETDRWGEHDNTCSYCGSLNPEAFMERLEAGDVRLGPTDKNYKVYVENDGGETFRQTYRDCPRDAQCSGPDSCTHWATREMSGTKFYFQHLSIEQMQRFVEILNEKRIQFGAPGRFYVTPFFISYCEQG